MARQHSTFPLPDDVIRREKLRALFTSPLIWLPQIVVLLAGLWLKWPWWGIALAMLAVFFVCALIWQARSDRLGKKITGRIIRKSNEGQDSELLGHVRAFEKDGFDGYAVTLGKFVQLKQQIEKELHADGDVLSKEAQEVESMVDSLCFGIVEQFAATAEIERRLATLTSDSSEQKTKLAARRKERLGKVIDAYKSLRKMRSQLSLLIRPSSGVTRPADTIDLDSVLRRLKSEDDIASRTRSRIDHDLG